MPVMVLLFLLMRRHYANMECRVKNYIKTIKVILSVAVDGFKKICFQKRKNLKHYF